MPTMPGMNATGTNTATSEKVVASTARKTSFVPFEAASTALVVVGFLMMTQVKGIDFDDIEVAFPAFLTIILMPFTYSISAGIGAGFVMYVILKSVRGKARQIHPLMWVVAALFVVYFAIGPLTDWLT
jgi:AGZA family xanthine/uracil permease-like MFS transporter